MNLTIFVLLLFVAFMFQGYKQGFVKVAFSLVAWLVGIVGAYILTPIIADQLITNTDIPLTIETVVYEQITNAVGELNVEGLESLPESVQQIVLGDYESMEELIENGAIEAVDVSGIALSITNMIALVIALFGMRFILYIIEKIFLGVSKLPLIGTTNRLLGIVAGAAKGLIWTWVILAVVEAAAFTGYNTTLFKQVGESVILTWLSENNIILNLLEMFM